MENEAEMIRHQMEDTRTALTEKLELLEDQVISTVKGTTDAVSETVDAVKETVEQTVEGVKETVQNTVDGMSESVEAVKESVRDAFDLRGHMEKHPWATLGGCVLAGYALGALLPSNSSGRSQPHPWGAGNPPDYDRDRAKPAVTEGLTESLKSGASAALSKGWEAFQHSWGPVVDQLKGMAIGTTAGLISEMVLKSVPPTMKENVAKMFDDVTESLGGKVMRSEECSTHPHEEAPIHR